MHVQDVNFLSADNALQATDHDGSLQPISSISPGWLVTGGSGTFSDKFENRYSPEYFSLVVTPSDTGNILIYLNNVPVPTDVTHKDFELAAHALFYCESPITVQAKIGEQSVQIPEGRVTLVNSSDWTNCRSNTIPIGKVPSFSFLKMNFVISGHEGSPVYMTMPTLYDYNRFLLNNFVNNGRNFIPTYYWDIDGQQSNPSFPMFRVFDVFTSDADEVLRSYVDFFEYEEDDKFAWQGDNELTKSILVNPDWVDPEYRPWLSQFTGSRVYSNVQQVTRTFSTIERTSDLETDDQLWSMRDEFAGLLRLEEADAAISAEALVMLRRMNTAGETTVVRAKRNTTPTTGGEQSIDWYWDDLDTGVAGVIFDGHANVKVWDPIDGKHYELGADIEVDPAPNTSLGGQVSLSLHAQPHNQRVMNRLTSEFALAVPQGDISGGGKTQSLYMFEWLDQSPTTVQSPTYVPVSAGYDVYSAYAVADVDASGTLSMYVAPSSGSVYFFQYDRRRDIKGLPQNSSFTYVHGNPNFGEYVCLSSDGTVAVGWDSFNKNIAVIDVDRNAATATLRGTIPVGVDIGGLAISSDGNTVACTAVLPTNEVRFYDYDGTNWNTRVPIEAANPAAISISGDGCVVAFGYNSNYVASYKYVSNDWVEILGVGFADDQIGSDFGSSVALDSTGRFLVVGAPSAPNEDFTSGSGRVFGYVLADNDVNEVVWANFTDFSSAIQETGMTDFEKWGMGVDVSDGGACVAISWESSSLYTGTAIFYFSQSTASYGYYTFINTDHQSGVRWTGAKLNNWAAVWDGGDLNSVIFKDSVTCLSLTDATANRALAVTFTTTPGTASASLESALSGLSRGDAIYVESGDGPIYKMIYDGNWCLATSENSNYPASYVSYDTYVIHYSGRMEIVSGTSGGNPAVDEFNGTANTWRGGTDDGILGNALHVLATSANSNFFSNIDANDFINWQLQNSFYGYKSGSRESMVESVRQVLDGAKTVAVSPNYAGLDYRIHIRTLTSETPNIDAVTGESLTVLNAASPTRPVGFYFTHETVDKLFFTLNNIGIGRLDLSVLGT